MRYVLLFCNIAVLIAIISGQVFNPNPSNGLFLTKYIENDDIVTAQNLSLVSHPDIPIRSYAGYFTVNKEYNSNLFFWFFPAKVNTDDAPVLLWLQGGPGSSSLLGLFTENGPISISSTQKVIPREYSWHLNHNLIYIDSPVGSGFSFTDSDSGYAKNEDDVGQDLLNALQQFFLLFPNLQKNEFFISGESYAGKYVPALGYAIYQDSKRQMNDSTKPKINLKGIAIGNGITDPLHQFNYGDYLYELGLIDANGRREFLKLQDHEFDCIKKRDFLCALKVFGKLLIGIGAPYGTLFHNLTGYNMYNNYLKTENDDRSAIVEFIQKIETRRAIHVGNHIYHGLTGSAIVIDYLKLDFMDSLANRVAELLSHYPILIYTGQLDIIVAYPLVENYLKYLNFTGAEQYKNAQRYIWRVDNEIAGYVKYGGNLTDVLIRNAGHMAPTDQPKWVLDMLFRFTHHKGFP